jgi:hypothetical protein
MRYALPLLLSVLASVAHGDTFTVGPNGIKSVGYLLPDGTRIDGDGVGVGMVEAERPGKPGYDTNPDVYHDAVRPHRVFNKSFDAPDNGPIHRHAQGVGGIIIGDGSFGGYSRGVAPDAKLYAGASFPDGARSDIMQTFHKIATFPISAENPDVKVISSSGFWDTVDGVFMDGNDDLTQYIDWSAKRHDITYVILGPSIAQMSPAPPTDNFNGITVGASQTSPRMLIRSTRAGMQTAIECQ